MKTYELHYLDIIVIFTYLFLIIWYGLKKGKQSSSEEYFLAGRDATWPIVGISLFAANISSTTLVGLSGDAYSTGISVFNYEWMAAVILIFFSIFFLPFYLSSKVYTMPEFLDRRFDWRSRYYFSFVTLLGNIVIDMAAGLYAGSLILKLVFPETPTWLIISLLAFAAAIYTIPGGLNSVIYTEVVQAILLIGCSIILAIITLYNIGGWGEAKAVTPPEMLSLVRPIDDSSVPWPGLLFGVPLLGFYFWCNNQFMVQRTLSSKSLNHGRWGALFAGLIKLPVLYIMVLPGTMARVLYNDDGGTLGGSLARPDLVYPSLIFDLMPIGLIGLMLAGLLAAMASSISATLNSASTLITMDFIRTLKPDMTSKQLVTAGKISTVILVILAAIWTPQVEKFESLFKYLQLVLSFISPPVVAVFLIGLFWKRANAHGAFAAFVFGFFALIFLVIYNGPPFASAVLSLFPGLEPLMYYTPSPSDANVLEPNLHFLYIAPVLCLACALIMVVVSLATPPPGAEKTLGYTWENSMYTNETKELASLPWYLNFRYQAIILLIITAYVVISFW